jgi:hypothetical protein
MKENTINNTQYILTELDKTTITELQSMPEFEHLPEADFIAYCQALKQFAKVICAMPIEKVEPCKTTFTFIKSQPINKLQAA